MNASPQAQPKLTPRAVLAAAQQAMMEAVDGHPDYASNEPFPIEISELFLYSPDGTSALLVFQFLGNECVLSENEVAVEDAAGEIMVLEDPFLFRALEFLVMRIRTLKAIGV